jgi:PleD family two-component response regulator
MEKFVLIIDEDTRELRKLREFLAREGYSIMTATDRKTAEEISRNVHVMFVLGTASALGFTKK